MEQFPIEEQKNLVVLYSYHVILLLKNKKETNFDAYNNVNEFQKCCVDQKKPDIQEYTLYDHLYEVLEQ